MIQKCFGPKNIMEVTHHHGQTHLEAMGNNVPVTYWATAGGDPLSAHESRSFKHFKWTLWGQWMDGENEMEELSPERS